MVGNEVTLQDIVLELEPQAIDLFCYEEELPTEQDPSSAEEPDPVKIPYKVVAPCGCCGSRLRLCLLATISGIRTLETLLLEEINLLCPPCRHSLQHGNQ